MLINKYNMLPKFKALQEINTDIYIYIYVFKSKRINKLMHPSNCFLVAYLASLQESLLNQNKGREAVMKSQRSFSGYFFLKRGRI